MTTRIDHRFATLKAQGRAALVTFLTAGDPNADTSLAILKALPQLCGTQETLAASWRSRALRMSMTSSSGCERFGIDKAAFNGSVEITT